MIVDIIMNVLSQHCFEKRYYIRLLFEIDYFKNIFNKFTQELYLQLLIYYF